MGNPQHHLTQFLLICSCLLIATGCGDDVTVRGSQVQRPNPPITADLTTPTGLAAEVLDGNEIILSWNVVQNADTYDILRLSGDVEHTIEGIVHPPLRLAGQLPGLYRFQIRARSNLGKVTSWSPKSASVEVVAAALSTPANLEASLDADNLIQITWNAVSNATQYELRVLSREPQSSDETKNNIIVMGTSHSFTGSPGVRYRFQVRAQNPAQSLLGNWTPHSNEVEILPDPLEVPSTPVAQLAAQNQISVTWNSVFEADSYAIRILYNALETVVDNVSETSFSMTGSWNSTYQFQIKAKSSDNRESPWSNLSNSVGVPPPVPTNLTGSIMLLFPSEQKMEFNWSAASGAVSYELEVNGTPISVSGTSHKPFTASWNSTQRFRVRSVSANGAKSAWSEGISYTMPPSPPSSTTTSFSAGCWLDVSWTPSQTPSSFRLYRYATDNSEPGCDFHSLPASTTTIAFQGVSSSLGAFSTCPDFNRFFKIKIGRAYRFRIEVCGASGTCSTGPWVGANSLPSGWTCP